MATAFGPILEEGHWAERALVPLLNSTGVEAVASTPVEDHRLKVDLWCRHPVHSWIGIQLCTNCAMIAGAKGIDALRRGIVPAFVDPVALEAAVDGNVAVRQRLLGEFWSRVDQILAAGAQLGMAPLLRPQRVLAA